MTDCSEGELIECLSYPDTLVCYRSCSGVSCLNTAASDRIGYGSETLLHSWQCRLTTLTSRTMDRSLQEPHTDKEYGDSAHSVCERQDRSHWLTCAVVSVAGFLLSAGSHTLSASALRGGVITLTRPDLSPASTLGGAVRPGSPLAPAAVDMATRNWVTLQDTCFTGAGKKDRKTYRHRYKETIINLFQCLVSCLSLHLIYSKQLNKVWDKDFLSV